MPQVKLKTYPVAKPNPAFNSYRGGLVSIPPDCKDPSKPHKYDYTCLHCWEGLNTFKTTVIKRLTRERELTQEQYDTANLLAFDWFSKYQNIKMSDMLKYILCTEEFSPELDEDLALKRMDRLRKKYDQSSS